MMDATGFPGFTSGRGTDLLRSAASVYTRDAENTEYQQLLFDSSFLCFRPLQEPRYLCRPL